MIPPPKRKKKCQACGNYVYVRTHPHTKEKTWLTEEGAAEVDQLYTELSTASGIIDTLKAALGIEKYNGQFEALQRSNPEFSYSDVVMQLCLRNRHLADRMMLFQMALFAFDAGYRQYYYDFASASQRRELEEYQANGVTHVEILGGECEACEKLDGKTMTVRQAMDKMPLPCKKCTTWLEPEEIKAGHMGYCRCCYAPMIKESAIDDIAQSHGPAGNLPPKPTAQVKKRKRKPNKRLLSTSCTVLLVLLAIWFVLATMVKCSISH